MEVLNFIYNGKEVDFQPTSNDNVMVNATQMAKIFGKEIKRFNELESTKTFIDSCLNFESISRESRLIGIEKREDLIISIKNSGTWMHRILALKFAAWLDVNFEIWIFCTIDRILFGHFTDMKEATIEKLKAEKELQDKKEKLILENPELAEIFDLELKISKADKKRIKAIKASMAQFKLNLFPENSQPETANN